MTTRRRRLRNSWSQWHPLAKVTWSTGPDTRQITLKTTELLYHPLSVSSVTVPCPKFLVTRWSAKKWWSNFSILQLQRGFVVLLLDLSIFFCGLSILFCGLPILCENGLELYEPSVPWSFFWIKLAHHKRSSKWSLSHCERIENRVQSLLLLLFLLIDLWNDDFLRFRHLSSLIASRYENSRIPSNPLFPVASCLIHSWQRNQS